MLTIGTFSRATHLSVRTLRRYHEQGLLVPAVVDPDSGYRSYERAQVLDAQLIRRLRDLDLPLAVVAELVAGRDPGRTATVLTEHRETLRRRRSDLDRMIVGVTEVLSGAAPLDVGLVHLRDQPADPVLIVRGRTPESDFASWFARAFRVLVVHAGRYGLTVDGPSGARFPDREWDPDDVEVEALLPVTRAVAGPGVVAGRLSAGRLAVVLHAGAYDGIVGAHGLLGQWAAGRGLEPDGSLQEQYLVGPHHTPDTSAWRTEVGWLVQPATDHESDPESESESEFDPEETAP